MWFIQDGQTSERKYFVWIMKNVDVLGSKGKCLEISLKMKEAFPELIRVRGFYHSKKNILNVDIETDTPHWWLKTVSGKIVDPTLSQFEVLNVDPNLYKEWDESLSEPTGKCMNCGGYCFNNKDVCSEKCEKEFIEYTSGQGEKHVDL